MNKSLVTIDEPETGSRAAIAVSQGFNCFEFQTVRDGQAIDVLWAHPEFASGTQRPSGSGIPLLFPFAGRIRGTSFTYQGREYALEEGDGCGNAIHGFVMQRAWRVIEQTERRVVGQFQAAIDDPSLLERWPSDFRITVAYELRGGTLHCQMQVDNPGDAELPFGFATHAYFRVPLTPQGAAENCVITVPVHREWELVDLIPTGRELPASGMPDLSHGFRLGDHPFDNVFAGLDYDRGRCTTRIEDPRSGRRVTQTFDNSFGHCVVYTPPHREAVCIEPYTHLPDPFRLGAQGIETGFRTLAPGASYQTEIVIEVE